VDKLNINSSKITSKNNNIEATLKISKLIKGKNVLYIATTYKDYLRVQQEITLLENHSNKIYLIVSNSKSYFIRLLYVYIRSIFFMNKIDVVFIGFAPQLVLPFLKWRFFRKKIIIDFFISLHDTFIMDRQRFSISSWVAKLCIYLDKATLKKADLVICDTKEHGKYFVDELGCKGNKIETLYLQADSRYYYPKIVAKPKHLKEKYIVLYFGSVLPLQGISTILESIKLNSNKNIYFIMIGPLESPIIDSDNVKFIKWLDQKELSKYIAFSDLCLAGHFHGKIAKAKRTIPGKAYIYEAMEKLMILGDNMANKERYPEVYNKVKFVEMGNAECLLDVIERSYEEYCYEKK
jgi:glycosyltransferase involved in cell wall biosynthesis